MESTILQVTATVLAPMLLMTASARGDNEWSVSSPSGNLKVVVERKDGAGAAGEGPCLSYRVLCQAEEVLPRAPLGFTAKRLGQFQTKLHFLGKSTRIVDERYTMPVGKKSQCCNKGNELTMDFANETNAKMSVIFRVYDDGIAYRYLLDGTGEDTVTSEASAFHIPTGSKGWFARYTYPNYEWYYDAHEKLTGIDFDIAVPALFLTANSRWIYVTEAAVDGTYAGARFG